MALFGVDLADERGRILGVDPENHDVRSHQGLLVLLTRHPLLHRSLRVSPPFFPVPLPGLRVAAGAERGELFLLDHIGFIQPRKRIQVLSAVPMLDAVKEACWHASLQAHALSCVAACRMASVQKIACVKGSIRAMVGPCSLR